MEVYSLEELNNAPKADVYKVVLLDYQVGGTPGTWEYYTSDVENVRSVLMNSPVLRIELFIKVKNG